MDEVFAALLKSAFRRRFRLRPAERDYLIAKGLPMVLKHAQDLIGRRLASAKPENDGRQTPFHGHPVFVAQHATASCCRSCLAKWHGIPKGRMLNVEERSYILEAIERWLKTQIPYEAINEMRAWRQCPETGSLF